MTFELKARIIWERYSGLIYWTWRFSVFSRPWYWLKTFVHIHWHCRSIAVNLDNCMRAMGQMKHSPDNSHAVLMHVETWNKLSRDGYKSLPNGWRWRKD